MREPETYRAHLADILEFTEGKRMLTITDVASYLGKSRKWARENLDLKGDVTAVALATKLAKM